MKQIFIVGHDGPDKLQVRESPDPHPAAGEIRIRVRARGVNFADILAQAGEAQSYVEERKNTGKVVLTT